MTVPAEAATGRGIAELAAELDRIFTRRDVLEKEIEEAFLAHPFGEILASLPGIGPRTGARILAEIGDGSRLRERRETRRLRLLAPVGQAAGTSLNAALARRGHRRLKNVHVPRGLAAVARSRVGLLDRPRAAEETA